MLNHVFLPICDYVVPRVMMAAMFFLVASMGIDLISGNRPAMGQEVTRELTPVQRGRGKAQLCTRCHGRLGMARAAQARQWPGTVAEFVEFNLLQFRSGKRIQAVMNAVAGQLSDIDIEDVALWYQSISGSESKKPLAE